MDNYHEKAEHNSGFAMYKSTVFGHCVRIGVELTDEQKRQLEPQLRAANDRFIAPDMLAALIQQSIR